MEVKSRATRYSADDLMEVIVFKGGGKGRRKNYCREKRGNPIGTHWSYLKTRLEATRKNRFEGTGVSEVTCSRPKENRVVGEKRNRQLRRPRGAASARAREWGCLGLGTEEILGGVKTKKYETRWTQKGGKRPRSDVATKLHQFRHKTKSQHEKR